MWHFFIIVGLVATFKKLQTIIETIIETLLPILDNVGLNVNQYLATPTLLQSPQSSKIVSTSTSCL